MSSLYSGTSSYADYFSIPDDGDSINASSFNVGLEALGDRTKYLLDTLNTLNAFVVATSTSNASHFATLDSEVAALYAAMQDGVWSLRNTNTTGTVTGGSKLAFGGATTGNQGFGAAISAAVGDRFILNVTGTAFFVHNSGQGITVTAQIQVSENGGGYSNVSHASVTFGLPAQASAITAGWYIPFSVTAVHNAISNAGNAAFRVLFTATFGVSGTGDSVDFGSDFCGTQEQIRVI